MFPTACVFLWVVGVTTTAHRLSANTGCSFQHLWHPRQNHGLPSVCSNKRNVPVHHLGCQFPQSFGTILRYSSPGMNSDSAKEKRISSSAEKNKSYVSLIRSCNLAGVVAATNEEGNMEEQGTGRSNDITLRFQRGSLNGSNLIAVTGETGSGKSLLVSRVADLVTGGKASSSLLQMPQSNDDTNGANESLMMERAPATVEMELQLHQPHISITYRRLERMGLNAASILGVKDELAEDSCAKLTLKRILPVLSYTDGNDDDRTNNNNKRIRFKSTCSINGHVVPLKALKMVGAPLVAIVDAPAAAAALKRPQSRMRMIDTAVPSVVLLWVSQLQNKFKKCKSHRESLERELASRVLPPSFTSMNNGNQAANDDDNALLRHWVEELDGFEARISSFCSSIVADTEQRLGSGAGLSLTTCLEGLATYSWMDNANDDITGNNLSRTTFSSGMYETLLDLADTLKELEGQIEAANNAYQTLASLSDAKSAITAVERARDFLMDATAVPTYMDATAGKELSSNDKSKAMIAAERAHDLLNQVEDALSACSRFLEDDDKGLLGVLQAERGACPVTVEKINEMMGEWNTLSRKHGIAPPILPSCHAALRQEYNGNVEAKTLLPKALEDEKKALKELEQACEVLSRARLEVSNRLTASITRRLPMLGMEGSTFEARVDPKRRVPSDIAAGWLGVDAVDFLLSHNSNGQNTIVSSENESDTSPIPYQGGKLENVASSGEKARILLAIECEIPGSVSSLCGGTTATSKTGEQEEEDGEVGRVGDDEGALVPPVVAIYDEIDAHVGGRAAVSVAQMLSEQSHACQVMTITHSPSVAAIADSHVVIQKQYLTASQQQQQQMNDRRRQGAVTVAWVVEGTRRRQELARMASGDLAPEEAETFAEALMRHGGANKHRI